MFDRLILHRFLTRHPIVGDTLRWVIPAIALGTVLRLMLLYYSPYAYWGADSRSYYDFAHKLFVDGDLSLVEKRRFLYPIVMAMVTVLPGVPLQWVAWLQHGFGLITLVPLAYTVRKNFVFWRWWIVPITVLYAGMPVILWYEHELLGETLFFAFIVWAMAGWSAWVKEERRERAQRLWWFFFVPFALFILTKPSGRFYWPGLLLGMIFVLAWRRMKRVQFAALGALMIVTLALGSKEQGAWLLYVASFPLTRLETPLHSAYKAQIDDLVKQAQAKIHTYYRWDDDAFQFLRNPGSQPERDLWAKLEKDDKAQARVHMALALEGIRAQPFTFLYLGVQRAVASANLTNFNDARFEPEHMTRRFRDDYEDALIRVREGRRTPIPLVLGFPKEGPIPSFEEMAPRFSPALDSRASRLLMAWVDGYQRAASLVSMPRNATLAQTRPTWLGWWLVVGIILAFLPGYRRTLGVWTLAALGYVLGVFLVSQTNPRYFGAAWPVLFCLLALPADTLWCCVSKWREKYKTAG
jgi:hypothetical protein